jgi:hypothetical protein
MPPVMPPPLRDALRPLAITFVPEIAGATASQWSELERRVTQALAARPLAMRRQLGLFVRVLEAAARIRYRTGLAALDAGRRTALLEAFAGSPLLLFRRGIWGLRTLIMLGWYTQPSVVSALGYRASPAGWGARR